MQGVSYLVAAYAVAWIGLFAYLAFLMLRIRSVNTELAAVTELVREQQERTNVQKNGHTTWKADQPLETSSQPTEEN